jgi:catechol 2,3-dioxygenase-like lactoylglutathione lyase family enzyme
MSIRGFNHVSVTCADLDRSLTFYVGVLGLVLRGRGETGAGHLAQIIGMSGVRVRWAELEVGNGQPVIELFQYLTPTGEPLIQRTWDPGSVHFAIEVHDIAALYDRLGGAGIVTRSAPVQIADGDWRGVKSLYAVDPDGVTVELLELPVAR